VTSPVSTIVTGAQSGVTALPRAAGAPNPGDVALCRAQVPLDAATDVEELAATYLGDAEGERFAAMPDRARIPWLLGRVAAKDAVRSHLTRRSFADIDPTRIVVENDAQGSPNVAVRGARLATRWVRVSIAHKPGVGVAVAARVRARQGAEDAVPCPAGIGIDVESVDPRPSSFEDSVLTPSERSLVAAGPDDRDTVLTRVWAVKEAAAKATGLGLRGRPKDFEVDAVDDHRMRCSGRWVATEPLRTPLARYIVAWTETP
jgi:phosphopantetheinyl transferase